MRNVLLIRIPPPENKISSDVTVQWGRFKASGELLGDIHVSAIARVKEGWLAEQSDSDEVEEVLPNRIILFISGGMAIHKKLPVNAGQKKHLSTALPFLIEEELAQDIDSIHLSSLLDRKTDSVCISAIPHMDMQALLALFDEQELSLDKVIVEGQFLDFEQSYTTLLMDSQSVMVASRDFATVCLDFEAVKFVLLAQQQNAPEESMIDALVGQADKSHLSQIKLRYSDSDFAPSSEQVDNMRNWLNSNGWLVDESILEHSVFEYFADCYFMNNRKGTVVDLRQGAYQCPRKAGRQVRRWKPVVAVLACWLVLELGLSSGQAFLYQRKTQDLWQETMTSYLQIFPQDQQAKNALKNQQTSFNVQKVLENRLRSAEKKQTGEPFLPLLQKVSAVSGSLDESIKFDPRSMDFNDGSGQLILEFQAGNLEAVEQFLGALNNAGLRTKLDSANQGKTGVLARMTIGR